VSEARRLNNNETGDKLRGNSSYCSGKNCIVIGNNNKVVGSNLLIIGNNIEKYGNDQYILDPTVEVIDSKYSQAQV